MIQVGFSYESDFERIKKQSNEFEMEKSAYNRYNQLKNLDFEERTRQS